MRKLIVIALLLMLYACAATYVAAEPALDAGIDAMVANHSMTPEQATQLKAVIHEILAGLGGGGVNWSAILGGAGTLIGSIFGISFLNRSRTTDQLAQIGLDEAALKKVAALVNQPQTTTP